MQLFELGFRRRALFISTMVFVLIFTSSVFGQEGARERFQKRRDQAVRSAEQREKAKQEAEGITSAVKPKPAIMNVDVQMALAGAEYPNFTDAKQHVVTRVADGEPLWLYIKFNGKLGDYVVPAEAAEDGSPRYQLFAEIAPQGDISALNRYVIIFRKEDLAASELKINLAPGLPGRNAAIPVFLDRVAASNHGVWQNELRLANSNVFPRSLTMNLATAVITLELPKGNSAYQKLDSAFDSILLRGTADVKLTPNKGSFVSANLKEKAIAAIRKAGVELVRFYFASDDWSESSSDVPERKKTKSVTAAFTYRAGENCFYGVAKIDRQFDFAASKFREPEINIEKDFALACTELN
ncbi:MAG: hypothetical protein ACRD6X_11330 [Pyrinomonadaceae bacterium]